MPIRPILRRDKSVSFYLPDTAPYIFYPGQEKDDILCDHKNIPNTVRKTPYCTKIIIL
jgi:hypothetical protein